jgi:hypothetical protein
MENSGQIPDKHQHALGTDDQITCLHHRFSAARTIPKATRLTNCIITVMTIPSRLTQRPAIHQEMVATISLRSEK